MSGYATVEIVSECQTCPPLRDPRFDYANVEIVSECQT